MSCHLLHDGTQKEQKPQNIIKCRRVETGEGRTEKKSRFLISQIQEGGKVNKNMNVFSLYN